MGNIFGRWEGSEPELGAVGSGSHTDAIPKAGMYDGVVGVVGPIEAIRALKAAGFRPKRSIEALMFTSEEPTRFGFGCVGSRAMAGVLDPAKLAAAADVMDLEGGSFAKAACAAGYGGCDGHEEMVAATKLPEGYYSSFVELHIEQGPSLEAEGVDIGVVTAVAAPAALNIEFTGDGGHAGAQLMPWRNDAGLAGAELMMEVEAAALATGAPDTVATVGVMTLAPGAINSVPRGAHLEVDIRDTDGPRRDGVVKRVLGKAESIAAKRKVRLSSHIINQDPPCTSGSHVVAAASEAAAQLGLTQKLMPSRAYHDTLFVALTAPTAMIFIPCYKGYSHRPDEYASPKAIGDGIKTLALTFARLSME